MISERTGRPITRKEHIEQSLATLFRTRIGTRVIRRHVGSNLPNLVDEPGVSEETRLDLIVAVATAILDFEPRIIPELVQPILVAPGRVEISLIARDRETGDRITLQTALR